MRFALALAAVVPLAYRASAQSTIVQPATYRSPSGALELAIDPSDRHGAGEARYRLAQDGAVVWERELPFTLLDALVRDDGRVAGNATTEGVWRVGELVVAVLEIDGRIVAEHRIGRETSGFPHGLPEPHVLGLRDAGERFALEVDRPARWWIHRWSDGGYERSTTNAPEGRGPVRIEPPPAPAVDELPELPVHVRTVALEWPVAITPESASDESVRPRTPRNLLIDGARRAWVSEFSTHVTHAFDLDGRHVAERVPAPGDFHPYRPGDWLALRGDGHLFVHGDSSVIEFAAEGQRVGRSAAELLTSWLFQPGGTRCWEVGGGEVVLFDGETVLVRNQRGANRRWFRSLCAAAVAPGGELVVLDDGMDKRDESGPWLHVFDAKGAPAAAFLAPCNRRFEELAFDGERIALRADHDLVLLRVDGTPIGRFSLPADTASPRGLAFAEGELWVLERGRARLLALRWEAR